MQASSKYSASFKSRNSRTHEQRLWFSVQDASARSAEKSSVDFILVKIMLPTVPLIMFRTFNLQRFWVRSRTTPHDQKAQKMCDEAFLVKRHVFVKTIFKSWKSNLGTRYKMKVTHLLQKVKITSKSSRHILILLSRSTWRKCIQVKLNAVCPLPWSPFPAVGAALRKVEEVPFIVAFRLAILEMRAGLQS